MSAQPRSCPGPEVLSRAVSGGADEALHHHMDGCARCSAAFAAEAALVGLIKEIEPPPIDGDRAERLEAVRSQLLSRLPKAAPPRLRLAPVFLAMAAAAALVLVIGRGWFGPAPAERRGTVVAQGAAQFLHEEARRDEVVRLREGEIQVDVERLRAGERFRVVVGDGEVEVRGTAFRVLARADRLEEVRVLHGLVEVRPAGRAAVLLHGGERWSPPVVAAAPTPSPAETAAGALPVAPAPAAPLAIAPSSIALPPIAGPRERERERERDRERTPAAMRPRAPRPRASAPAPTSPAVAPAPVAAPPKAAPPLVVAPPRPPSPAERAFEGGWQALRTQEYRGAARLFDQAVGLSGDQALAEDARFWRAVAQGRAGQHGAAVVSLRDFLGRHPRSPRALEASSILGWQLLRTGALDEAERLFRAAAQAPLKQVRDSADAGLKEVAARRPPR